MEIDVRLVIAYPEVSNPALTRFLLQPVGDGEFSLYNRTVSDELPVDAAKFLLKRLTNIDAVWVEFVQGEPLLANLGQRKLLIIPYIVMLRGLVNPTQGEWLTVGEVFESKFVGQDKEILLGMAKKV